MESNMSEAIGKWEAATVTYKWILEESCLIAKKTGERLQSPEISLGDSKYCSIALYPRGQKEKYKDYVSIYLRAVKGDFEANFQICIIDDAGQIVYSKTTQWWLFKESGHGFGFPMFKLHQRLIQENITFPPTGSSCKILTLLCEVMIDSSLERIAFFKLEPHIRLREFDDLEKLINNESFSDVTLILEGKKFHAHKNILASKSEVFAAMFTHNMKENELASVNIEDVTCDVMNELLRFVYAGKVGDLKNIAMDLLVAADKYLIKGLKMLCEYRLVENVNAENVFEYLNFASRHGALFLRKMSLDFFKSNMKKVLDQSRLRLNELDTDNIHEITRIIAGSLED